MAMDIIIKNLQTKVSIRIPRIDHAARRTLAHFRVREASLSIVFVGPRRMKALNARYLSHDYVTDILTFDYRPSSGRSRQVSAELVIAPSVAARQAKDNGTTLAQELQLYVVHGILHLMGYDDHGPRQTARMRRKERQLVEIINN